MTKKTFLLAVLAAAFAMLAAAADVTGKWTAQVPGRDNQTREVVFHFKAEGAKLTGTMSGPQGADIAISDGKVDGDSIAFSVKLEFNGNSMVRNYSGTVSGDEMKMKSQTQRGAQEFVAKRAK
jgi:opacity protein-like surface antigen